MPPTDLLAWCWEGERRWLVVVNLGSTPGRGHTRLPWDDMVGQTYRLSDPTTGVSLTRSGDELRNGLSVDLGAWQWHLFAIDPAS